MKKILTVILFALLIVARSSATAIGMRPIMARPLMLW